MAEEISDIEANDLIAKSIKRIALKGIVDHKGNVKDAKMVQGYVKAVHDDPSDDLYGTVDVQEYGTGFTQQEIDMEAGLHRGVRISSLQDNSNGTFAMPLLHSAVTVAIDPGTLDEYVLAYSHTSTHQIQAHEKVKIGVVETQPYNEDDNYRFFEVPETGQFSETVYTSTSVETKAKNSNDNDGSSLLVDGDKVQAVHKDASLLVDAQKLRAAFGSEEIIINKDGVFLGDGSATESAVLGQQLAQLMLDWLDALTQVKTMTQGGPQPFINLAKFVALKTKVSQFKANTTGFLSKHVKVQA